MAVGVQGSLIYVNCAWQCEVAPERTHTFFKAEAVLHVGGAASTDRTNPCVGRNSNPHKVNDFPNLEEPFGYDKFVGSQRIMDKYGVQRTRLLLMKAKCKLPNILVQ